MGVRLFATLPVAIAVAVSACGGSEDGSPSSEGSIVVSATEGTVKGVGIGDSQDAVERVFGPSVGGRGWFPVGERFTGPQAMPAGHWLRYRGFAFLASDTAVFSLVTTVPGARTERGVGVGDALEGVREA